MREKTKVMKRVLGALVCMMLALTMVIPVCAEEASSGDAAKVNSKVKDTRQGVVQVMLVYEDETGEEWQIQSGSGFLIGTEETATTVITANHVVTMDGDTLNDANAYFTDKFGHEINIKDEVKIKIVIKGDVTIGATCTQGSNEVDFAVLELEQAIGGKSPLTLAVASDLEDIATQSVFSLGFPWLDSITSDIAKYTTEEVNITSGTVNKQTSLSNTKIIQHSCDLTSGNSGGPLVNEDGVVIGVNVIVVNDQNVSTNVAVEIDEITEILDMLNVGYESSEGTVNPRKETEETSGTVNKDEETEKNTEAKTETVDKAELTSAIATAEGVKADTYSEESYAVFEGALSDAKTVNAKADATQDQVDSAASALKTAQSELVEKSGLSTPVLIGIIAGVVILIAIIIVVIVMTSKKGKNKKEAYAGTPTRPEPAPTPVPTPTPNTVGSTPFTGSPVVPFNDEGAGETSLLNEGAGETTLLSSQMTPTATLVRKSNNETGIINKQVFKIGKEKRKVDFWVSNNNSISRVHAEIVYRDGNFYIVDQNATNLTFVNGNKISPGQEVKLSNGDKIKLSDEEFEFRV